MARKKKGQLPSGSIRVQVAYYDEDGNRHRKSFTGSTKAEAEYLAAVWTNTHKQNKNASMSVLEASERYIKMKEGVLSPASIREYKRNAQNHLSKIDKPIADLTNEDIQIWVSDLAADLEPKTVKTVYGLLASVMDMFRPDYRLKVTLPQMVRKRRYMPSDEDVRRLLDHVRGKELEVAILLAACGPLRRGEICCLTRADVIGNTVTVNKSMVLDSDHTWIVKKNPKTYSSNRTIPMDPTIIDKLLALEPGEDGRLFHATPDQITKRFIRAVKYAHLENTFSFHMLRHYSASIFHALGVSDRVMMHRGGWSSASCLKQVYEDIIDAEAQKQTEIIFDHFSDMVSGA